MFFQAPNDIPIHLKGGPGDRMLFMFTGLLCAVGLAKMGMFFYDFSFPKKK